MPAANFTEIYDFETAIESAFETLCNEAFIDTSSSNTKKDFSDKIPRVEFVLQLGGEAGHNSTTTPHHRADTFTASLTGALITLPQQDDTATRSQHAEYRATIRNIMAKARRELSDNRADLLPYHNILDIVSSGSSAQYQSEEGHWMTRMNYEIKFAVRPDAWPSE
jgi:hypothetical protein